MTEQRELIRPDVPETGVAPQINDRTFDLAENTIGEPTAFVPFVGGDPNAADPSGGNPANPGGADPNGQAGQDSGDGTTPDGNTADDGTGGADVATNTGRRRRKGNCGQESERIEFYFDFFLGFCSGQ